MRIKETNKDMTLQSSKMVKTPQSRWQHSCNMSLVIFEKFKGLHYFHSPLGGRTIFFYRPGSSEAGLEGAADYNKYCIYYEWLETLNSDYVFWAHLSHAKLTISVVYFVGIKKCNV